MRGKGEIINGYELIDDWKPTGQAQVSFCRKNGKEFFIKKFLYPTYPENRDMFTEEDIRFKIRECDAFEKHHNEIKRQLTEITTQTSNLVIPVEIFRVKAFWYKTYDRVTGMLSLEEITKIPDEEKIKIFSSAANCLQLLHNRKIIHGDIKHDNIMVVRKNGGYVARIIDFDSSYFENNVPDSPVGDFVYWSPELARFNQDTEKKDAALRKAVTCKGDVFALGLVFCRYLTGKLPEPRSDELPYPWQMVIEKRAILTVPDGRKIATLIDSMLNEEYDKRPTAFIVGHRLRDQSIFEKKEEGSINGEKDEEGKKDDKEFCCDKPKLVDTPLAIKGKRKQKCENCGKLFDIETKEGPKLPIPPRDDKYNHCGNPMQKRKMVLPSKTKSWYQCLKCGHRENVAIKE